MSANVSIERTRKSLSCTRKGPDSRVTRKHTRRGVRASQRAAGAAIAAIGAAVMLLEGDATASVFLCPLGLWVMLTKQSVLY